MNMRHIAGLALAMSACVSVSSAVAGPAGSGLAHTEDVARRAAAAKLETVHLTAPSHCVPSVVTALRQHDAVKDVTVASGDQTIKVRTDAVTAKGGDLQTLAAKVCASNAAAS